MAIKAIKRMRKPEICAVSATYKVVDVVAVFVDVALKELIIKRGLTK